MLPISPGPASALTRGRGQCGERFTHCRHPGAPQADLDITTGVGEPRGTGSVVDEGGPGAGTGDARGYIVERRIRVEVQIVGVE